MWRAVQRWVRCLALFGSVLSLSAGSATALTFKKGQVLGPDGFLYFGASPEVRQNLIRRASETGDKSGVYGRSLFIVAGDDITFVPLVTIAGQAENKVIETIGNAIVANITGIPNLKLSTVTAAQILAETKSIPVGKALIEQAFVEAAQATQNADVDSLSAKESQELLTALLGGNLVNADQSPVSDEQIIGLLKDGDFEALDVLIGGTVVASDKDIGVALTNLGNIADSGSGFMALTEEAWQGISTEDLNEAIEQANDYAANTRAAIAAQLAADPVFAASPDGQALAEEYGL